MVSLKRSPSALNRTSVAQRLRPSSPSLRPSVSLPPPPSVESAPVAAVAGHQTAGDEQDQVHKPPDAESSQGEELPHGRARVAQAEAVHPETAQEERVQQSGDEVVPRVSATTAGQSEGNGPGDQETRG